MDADAQADCRPQTTPSPVIRYALIAAIGNGVVRMFQAISLETDADDAKLLAFSALSLIAGVKRVEKADLELTAIVEPIRPSGGRRAERRADRAVRFGRKSWRNMTIRVMTSSELPRMAETAGGSFTSRVAERDEVG